MAARRTRRTSGLGMIAAWVLLSALCVRLVWLDLQGEFPARFGAFSAVQLVSGALVAGLCAVASTRVRLPSGWVNRLALLVCGTLFLRALWIAPNPMLAATIAYRMVGVIAVATLAASMPLRMHRSFALVVLASTFPGLVTFFVATRLGFPPPALLQGYYRFAGYYSSFQEAAQAFGAFFFVGGAVWVSRRERGIRAVAAVQMAASVIALSMTHQRATMVALAVAVVLWLVLARRFVVAGSFVVGMVLVLASIPQAYQRYSDFWRWIWVDDWRSFLGLGTHRVYIWFRVLFAWSGEPLVVRLFGGGFGAQYALHPKHFDAHSDWLSLVCQLGTVGTGVVGGLFWEALRRAWALRRRNEAGERDFANLSLTWTAVVVGLGAVSGATFDRVTPAWLFAAFTGMVFSRYDRVHQGGQREQTPIVVADRPGGFRGEHGVGDSPR